MKFIATTLAAAAALFTFHAAATDIRWSASDTFEHTATVSPGKAEEVCGMIESRYPVMWRFSASGPLTFDIHRHSGEQVIYQMRSYMTREQQGKFSPTFNFDWCWMWVNESAEPVTVQVELKR
jgi:hypothetical protein